MGKTEDRLGHRGTHRDVSHRTGEEDPGHSLFVRRVTVRRGPDNRSSIDSLSLCVGSDGTPSHRISPPVDTVVFRDGSSGERDTGRFRGRWIVSGSLRQEEYKRSYSLKRGANDSHAQVPGRHGKGPTRGDPVNKLERHGVKGVHILSFY